jgi:hypothetical protein
MIEQEDYHLEICAKCQTKFYHKFDSVISHSMTKEDIKNQLHYNCPICFIELCISLRRHDIENINEHLSLYKHTELVDKAIRIMVSTAL